VRIFIDSSYIDFKKQPTGIPRVVLKYIESGYEWGDRNGVDVVPVLTVQEGLIPVRPVPGKSPPRSTLKYVKPQISDAVHGGAAAAHLRQAEGALRSALIDAGLPDAVRGVESGVASLFANLAAGIDSTFEIGVRPGDIVFYPAYWHDLDTELFEQLKVRGAKIFILVHDILPITFAKFYKTPWRKQFADNLLAAAWIADGMLAVSNYTADQVMSFARENGVELPGVHVIHNGYDPLVEDARLRDAIDAGSFSPSYSKRELHEFFRNNQPYLMVGTIEPKKGHVPVIQAFEKLWHGGLQRKLALIGRTGWMEEQVVDAIEGSPFFGDKLVWFDNADDADLYAAYRHSRALIFSSYAEGFGIPMVEAGMAQLPLVCYDTRVAREVSGDNALYYSNYPQLAAHIARLEDDSAHASERARLKDFSWPSWRETGFRLFDYLAATAGR
jgi:alpha-1,2-rhamnosyltransferase